MTKILDTRRPAAMRADMAGPTALGDRTPSCGRGLGVPWHQASVTACGTVVVSADCVHGFGRFKVLGHM